MRHGRFITYGVWGFGLTGLAGLYVSRIIESESLLLFSLVFLLVASVYVSLETILSRQEPVSHGEYSVLGYFYGLQAVLSGLSYLLLSLAVLLPVLLWLVGWGGWLQGFLKTNPGLLLVLGGLWLFLNQSGRVIGKTYAQIQGTATDGKIERGISLVNMLLEKGISTILSIAGLLLLLWGLISLCSGKGPLEMLLAVL